MYVWYVSKHRHNSMLGVSGSVWERLGLSGSVWGAFGDVWERFGVFGSVLHDLEHLNAFRALWERMGSV